MPPRIIIPHIVRRHLDTAAHLALHRPARVQDPAFTLDELAHEDERLAAHLDGLAVAGDDGWALAWAALTERADPGRAAVVGWLALTGLGADAPWLAALSAAASTVEGSRAILGVAAFVQHLQPAALATSTAADPALATALRLAAQPAGVTAADLARDAPAPAAAAEAALHGGRSDLLDILRPLMTADALAVRIAAARAVALLGDPTTALPVLVALAESGAPSAWRAAEVAARIAAPDDVRAWISGAALPPAVRAAAAGAAGDPALLPLLFTLLPSAPARATAAIIQITGLDAGGLGHGDETEAGLPVGDADTLHARLARLPVLAHGVRHLAGRPVDLAHATAVLATGGGFLRAAAALDRQWLVGGALPDTAAPAWRQRW